MSTIKYWRLAIWKAVSGSVLIIGTTCPAIILNWDTMTGRGQAVALIGMGMAVVKFLDAFIDQTVARLAQGKPPYDPGGTSLPELKTQAPGIMQRIAVFSRYPFGQHTVHPALVLKSAFAGLFVIALLVLFTP